MTRKRRKTRSRQQLRRVRARTEKPPFCCSRCGYWSVCLDGLCLHCLDRGHKGPNVLAMERFEAKVTAFLARVNERKLRRALGKSAP